MVINNGYKFKGDIINNGYKFKSIERNRKDLCPKSDMRCIDIEKKYSSDIRLNMIRTYINRGMRMNSIGLSELESRIDAIELGIPGYSTILHLYTVSFIKLEISMYLKYNRTLIFQWSDLLELSILKDSKWENNIWIVMYYGDKILKYYEGLRVNNGIQK